MKLTKLAIAKLVSEETYLNVKESIELVDKVLNLIKDGVSSGDGMELRGFGSMKALTSNRTIVRNIGKNEQMVVPPSKRIKFKPSKEFLDMCKK